MAVRKLNGSITDGKFVPGTAEAVWFYNTSDPAPLRFPLNRNVRWLGGQGIVGRDSVQEDPTFAQRYSGGVNVSGRVMWSEDMGGTAYVILKALKGGAEATYEELRDFYACHGAPPGGMTPKDFEDLVGRPDEGAAAGATRPGSAQWNAIPKTRGDLYHGDYWVGPDGLWYINENRANPRPSLPVPLGTSTSGGGGVSTEDNERLRRQWEEASGKLATARTTAWGLAASYPSGAGAPLRKWAAEAKTKLDEIAKIGVVVLVLCCMLPLSGCAAFRALNPFDGVRAADAEFHGTKAGEPISLTATVAGTLNDRAALAATLLGALGHSDPLGVLLPVAVVGEAQPRYVLCVDAMAEKCRQIPINAEVSFAGRPIGPGLLWKPSRLTAANYND